MRFLPTTPPRSPPRSTPPSLERSTADRSSISTAALTRTTTTGAATTADFFNAIAPDKVALLPGQTATYANVSNYVDGINGIFIDISGSPSIVASDFEFATGNNNPTSSGPAPANGWTAFGTGPTAPTITLFPGMGANGSERVALTWATGVAVSGKWLEVIVRGNSGATPDANTGLGSPDIFYFGSAPGDSGNSTSNFEVNATDEVNARNDPHSNFSNRKLRADQRPQRLRQGRPHECHGRSHRPHPWNQFLHPAPSHHRSRTAEQSGGFRTGGVLLLQRAGNDARHDAL